MQLLPVVHTVDSAYRCCGCDAPCCPGIGLQVLSPVESLLPGEDAQVVRGQSGVLVEGIDGFGEGRKVGELGGRREMGTRVREEGEDRQATLWGRGNCQKAGQVFKHVHAIIIFVIL
ncbi:hypothetical protein FGO68_gene14597 [Halteria grandinella]|uniref:Uncharacterized protein n=1 Tax=Halteria grandinella TaxID=5974 RepID=A0A8J8T1Y5_HALGN|nr:hypothetical protein FGO68_gene14597 [Halteria grandinella]